MSDGTIEASAPARADLAGGTLDLWPLHVLHPGSVTVNVAIDRRAGCRVRPERNGFRVRSAERGLDRRSGTPAGLLDHPDTALVGSLLDALGIDEPLEIELFSDVPFGSGLGGSSALTVALLGALEPLARRPVPEAERIAFVRDVETRVLGKPAGVQDYYAPLEGGVHILRFDAGATRSRRLEADAEVWERHATLFDTGSAHSSGMNNWEIFRSRLEGDETVGARLEGVRRAAVAMSEAVEAGDFPAMGRALAEEWEARRRLAPVVSTPRIEEAIACARAAVRAALASLGRDSVSPLRVESAGMRRRRVGPD